MLRPRWAERLAWVLVPVAIAAWMASQHRGSFFVYDEWVTIERVTDGDLSRVLEGFNGHLWVVAFIAYRLQVDLFGAGGAGFLEALLFLSLIALHVATSLVLRRLGVGTAVALVAGAVTTYFGPGAEAMAWQFLFPARLSLALALFAAYLVLGERRGTRVTVAVAVLLVVSVLSDSGSALLVVPLVGVLALVLWPRRQAVAALVPGVALLVGWTALDRLHAFAPDGCQNCWTDDYRAPLGWSTHFGTSLLLRAAGGLGGGNQGTGLVVLVVGTAVVVTAVRNRTLPRAVVAATFGAAIAAVVTVVSTTYSRAGFWPSEDAAVTALGAPSNRYVHPVALFLVLALLPAAYAAARAAVRTRGRVELVTAIGLAAVFVANLGPTRLTQDFYDGWAARSQLEARQSVGVLSDGCPRGTGPDPTALPLPDVSPQVTVALLQRLLDQGVLSEGFGQDAPPDVVARICRPA